VNAGELVLTIFGALNLWALVRGWQYLFGWLPAPQSLELKQGKLTPIYKDIDGVRYLGQWSVDGVVSWVRAEEQPAPPEQKKIKVVQGEKERTI